MIFVDFSTCSWIKYEKYMKTNGESAFTVELVEDNVMPTL